VHKHKNKTFMNTTSFVYLVGNIPLSVIEEKSDTVVVKFNDKTFEVPKVLVTNPDVMSVGFPMVHYFKD